MRDLLRTMGHESHVFSLTIDADLRDEVRPFTDPEAMRGEVTIFHFALPSPMTDAFGRLGGRRVLHYHNVTPAHFFAPYDPGIFRITVIGRQELARLPAVTDLALGVSEFNRQELVDLEFGATGVLPLHVDTSRITAAPPHPVLESILRRDFTNFLFVGRIAPNKRIEDVILLAEQFKRYVDARYRFIFVGRTDSVPRYYDAIRALVGRFSMLSDRFLFPGAVTEWELAAYYRTASVYISMSEHEGFCAPLVEAMAADVPVMAYASTAVPETLGGAGVLFAPKDMEYAAELLGQVAFDDAMRARVIESQRRRLADFSEDRIRQRLQEILA